MDYIAYHLRGPRDRHRGRFDPTFDRAGNLNRVGRNRPLDVRPFVDRDRPALDVAFDIPLDLDVTGAVQIADHLEIGTDDGPLAGARTETAPRLGW